MFDVQSGQSSQIAAHDAPIKAVKWIDAQGGILVTGSWDKTIKVSQSGPARTFLVLMPLTQVLGSPSIKSYRNSHAPRTVLHIGRRLSAYGCRLRGQEDQHL